LYAALLCCFRESGPAEREGTLVWNPSPDLRVELFTSIMWGKWDSGDSSRFNDPMWPERRVQVRGKYPEADPTGSVLVTDRQQLMISAGEQVDFYVRAVARVDGSVLVAFDTHYPEGTRSVEPSEEPGDTRRLLMVWDAEFSQPIAVADWKGEPDDAPAWARY
jgi:hypothetical protein